MSIEYTRSGVARFVPPKKEWSENDKTRDEKTWERQRENLLHINLEIGKSLNELRIISKYRTATLQDLRRLPNANYPVAPEEEEAVKRGDSGVILELCSRKLAAYIKVKETQREEVEAEAKGLNFIGKYWSYGKKLTYDNIFAQYRRNAVPWIDGDPDPYERPTAVAQASGVWGYDTTRYLFGSAN